MSPVVLSSFVAMLQAVEMCINAAPACTGQVQRADDSGRSDDSGEDSAQPSSSDQPGQEIDAEEVAYSVNSGTEDVADSEESSETDEGLAEATASKRGANQAVEEDGVTAGEMETVIVASTD